MVIRKISVGTDYKTAMHYAVGQSVIREAIDEAYKINCIKHNGTNIEVWIENKDKEIMPWKSYNAAVPVIIEYNINYSK